MGNKVKYVFIAVGIIACIVAGYVIGPKIVNTFFTKKQEKPVRYHRVYTNQKGMISVKENGVILLTTEEGRHYVLEGDNRTKVQKFAGKNLEVYGRLRKPSPEEIQIGENKATINYNINVEQFDTKPLDIGKPITPQEFEAIKKKVDEKLQFQKMVLDELEKDVAYDVIKGQISLEPFMNKTLGKMNQVLMLQDSYGDKYYVIGKGVYPILNNYATYRDIRVVLLGRVTYPLNDVPVIPGIVTFNAEEAYFEDLSRIKEEK